MSDQKDNVQRINVTSFENKNNSPHKNRQRTIARLLAIASILVLSAVLSTTLIGNSFAQAANNNTATSSSSTNTTSSANSRDCLAIAANIGGQAAPRPDICDVLILRQSPQIKMQSTNMSLNKFSTTNSLVEFMAVNTTKGASSSSSTSNPKVFVMGEFGLLESQLAPMLKAANNYNWTVSAIHNHMVLEKPKLIFMHWSAQGDLNTITTQIKNALLAVSKVPGSSSSGST